VFVCAFGLGLMVMIVMVMMVTVMVMVTMTDGTESTKPSRLATSTSMSKL